MSKKKKNINHEPCKDAVVFARVSSEKQEKGASIDAQKETINDYCKNKGLNIIKEYIITESTMIGDRRQYKEMLQFVSSCKQKIAIVVNCVDRLQRSYKDTPILDDMRKEGKIEVHFLRENLILTKDSRGMDVLFWNMCVLMANSYVLNLSDNVKRSLELNWSIGKWQGLAPIGYLNVRDNEGKADIIIDEERAPIIKKLFQEYSTGLHSLQSLWYLARELGLTSKEPNHFEKSPHYKKKTLISRNKIDDILKNSFYYGVMAVNDWQKPHIHGAIITKTLFDKVQEVLKQKSRKIFSHEQKYQAIPFTLRGIIRCGTCGCAITPERKLKPNGKIYTYLKCSHLRGNCCQGIVNEDILLEQLDKEVFSKIRIPTSLLEPLKKSVRKNLEETASLNASVKRNITNQLKELESKEDNLTTLYASNKIRENIYNRQIDEIANERIRLQQTTEKYADISKDIRETVDKVIDIAGNASMIMKTADPATKNELLNLLIADCELNDKELTYKVKAPFDKLLTCSDHTQWKAIPLENLELFTEVEEDVKRFER